MMGTVRARVRGVVREGGRTVLQAVDDAGREYAVEVPDDVAAAPACSTCGPTCGCAPCRLRHGDTARDGHHDHNHDEALVLVLAWSLHTLPAVAPSQAPAPIAAAAKPARVPETTSAPARPLDPAEVDAAFMTLMECLASPPPSTEPSRSPTTTAAPATDPLDELLGLLPTARL